MTTACLFLRGVNHRVGVGDVAVGDHVFQGLFAGQRQDEGWSRCRSAGGRTLPQRHRPRKRLLDVHLHHFFAGVQG
jgi:hypothetical protein